MYADRSTGRGFDPASMGVAVGINAVLIGALLFAAPDILPFVPKPPPTPIDIRPREVPPPPPPEPTPEKRVDERVAETRLPPPPERIETVDTIRPVDFGPVVTPGPSGLEGGVAGGTGTMPVDPPRPVPAPVIVAPEVDPRYADALQPTYPAEERRAGREGRVVVRVLVGTDGRVASIERVSAASDAFWRATEDQARRRWRFKPGTRDGVAVEAWRTMTLTFRLEG